MTLTPQPSINILIVDDEPKNLTVLETVLDDPAYRFFRAESAQQALLALIANDFALLILDVRMPDITGFELAKLIKERKRTARVPIIFLTAYYNEDQHVLDGYGSGAVDYLHKPVNPAVLRSKVSVFAELYRKSCEAEAANQALVAEVNERRLAQEKLNQTLGELEVFSYSLAHDLRAPLRSMRGFADVLLMDHANGLGVDGQDFLNRIVRAADRMDALVQDILNYSKVASGEAPLGPVDVGKVIHEVAASVPQIQTHLAEITVETPLPRVLANEAALTQIVSNLISNAVKFVAPGERPRVGVRGEDIGDFVRLWFEDNGIGIPKDAQARLFNLFVRVQRRDEYEGSGIGLAIVRKAASRMGGSVGVESEVGRGSRFWVDLKKVPEQQPAACLGSSECQTF